MTFKQFAEFLAKIETTASRNEMTVMLSSFFSELDEDEINISMYLFQGRLVPIYVSLEFNFSRKLMLRALTTFFEKFIDEGTVSKLYAEKGDVGLVVEQLLGSVSPDLIKESFDELKMASGREMPKKFDVNSVYELMKEIATSSGKGSQQAKIDKYMNLVLFLDPLSAKFVSRMILGELRLGVSDKTVLDSLSWFVTGDKSLRKALDAAYGAKNDIGELAKLVITNKDVGVEKLKELLLHIKLQPGIPVASKLVERESSSVNVWKRMEEPFVQPKLDGLRGQIHKIDPNTVKIFSRNMEDMTEQFPEIIAAVKNLKEHKTLILDSEIIGFVTDTGKYLSYQETMQRKRKYDIESFSEKFPVKAMCFDVLYIDDRDLTEKPIEERLDILKKLSLSFNANLEMLETKQALSVEELEKYFQSKVQNGLEGIITKERGSNYEPGTRNFKWIKFKANTQSDLVDTLDLTVLGYYIGRGQRAKFKVGALLAGVYDEKTDSYYSVGKVGSGIKDEQFPIINKDLEKIIRFEKPENVVVDKTLFPDVWVHPEIVIEVEADEITRSPNHTAAKGIKAKVKKDDPERGLSIRFPRLKVWKRDKKLPNSVKELVRIYELRKGHQA